MRKFYWQYRNNKILGLLGLFLIAAIIIKLIIIIL